MTKDNIKRCTKCGAGPLGNCGYHGCETPRETCPLIPQPQPRLLAEKHTGIKVDYRGLLKQARRGLSRDPGIAEMLRQLEEHMTELGQRWYAGDAAVVDELLQLYCIERDARAALAEQEAGDV